MTYSLINKCAKNYYNRTFIVQVIAKNVVTCFFLRHSVEFSALNVHFNGLSPDLLSYIFSVSHLVKISQSYDKTILTVFFSDMVIILLNTFW